MTHTTRVLQSVVTACVLICLAGCHPESSAPEASAGADTHSALEPRAVSLVRTEAVEEYPTVELTGELRAFEAVPVPAQVAGPVDRVLAEVGDRVSAGTPLAEVDRETYRLQAAEAAARVRAAEADVELSRRELERKKDLLSDHTIAQAVFDEAEARHDLAAAQLEAARAAERLAQQAFDRSRVQAPAAGSIAARHVSPGQWVEVGQAIVDLAVGGRLKVAAEVPENWARRLQGLRGFTFTVGNLGPYDAKIYSVEQVVEPSSRSFELTGVTAQPADNSLKPGMFVTVTLRSPDAVTTLWVPDTAVATSEMAKVMLVEDGKAVEHKVLVGRREEGRIEILDGLTAGQ